METYETVVNALCEVGVYERRDELNELVYTMLRASERDIVAARWMAGGALLASDESLLDSGAAPDLDTSRGVRESVVEFERAAEAEAVTVADPAAREPLAVAREKMRAQWRKFRTFTPVAEQAFLDALELVVENGEEGLAGEVRQRVLSGGLARDTAARYLRRREHSATAFASCAGKLYAAAQRLRNIYNTNRRSNDLSVYENRAAETLLEHLSAHAPRDFWDRLPPPSRPVCIETVDINNLHQVLLWYGVEAFAADLRAQIDAHVMDWHESYMPPVAADDADADMAAVQPAAAEPPAQAPPAQPAVVPAAADPMVLDSDDDNDAPLPVLTPAEMTQLHKRIQQKKRDVAAVVREIAKLQAEQQKQTDLLQELGERKTNLQNAEDPAVKIARIKILKLRRKQLMTEQAGCKGNLAALRQNINTPANDRIIERETQKVQSLQNKIDILLQTISAVESVAAENAQSLLHKCTDEEQKARTLSETFTTKITEKETQQTALQNELDRLQTEYKNSKIASLQQQKQELERQLQRLDAAPAVQLSARPPKRACLGPAALVYRRALLPEAAPAAPAPESVQPAPPAPEPVQPAPPDAAVHRHAGPLSAVYRHTPGAAEAAAALRQRSAAFRRSVFRNAD